MIDEQILQQAIRLLLDAAPGAKVILFGSHARGEARPDSDLDFLVIEPEVKDRLGEMTRLATVLAPLMIPTDVLVVSAERFSYWKDTPNTVYNRAIREGKVYEQVA